MKIGRCLLLGAVAILASACTTVNPPPDDFPGETIVFAPSYGPFCFGCVFTTITVAGDGRVWIEREQDIATQRSKRTDVEPVWRVSRVLTTAKPEQLSAFGALLAPYRPNGRSILSDNACATMFSDMPGTTVSWQKAGVKDELTYDFGCDPDIHARMRNDLIAAPALLGIAMPEQSWAATTRLH